MLISNLVFSFMMPVEDRSSVPGRGTAVEGVLESSIVRPGDSVVLAQQPHDIKALCVGIERAERFVKEGSEGEAIDIILGRVKQE